MRKSVGRLLTLRLSSRLNLTDTEPGAAARASNACPRARGQAAPTGPCGLDCLRHGGASYNGAQGQHGSPRRRESAEGARHVSVPGTRQISSDCQETQGEDRMPSSELINCMEGFKEEETVMASTKDVRSFECLDEEHAIYLLLRHGLPDCRIHEILNHCDSLTATQCAQDALAKMDSLMERRILLEKKLREVTEKVLEIFVPSRASSSDVAACKKTHTSSKIWLTASALTALMGALLAAVTS